MGDYNKEVKLFKALADENRLSVLNILKNGEICACRLLQKLNISQSTLSHHMKILCDAGIVNARKDGIWMHYSVSPDFLSELGKAVRGFTPEEKAPESEPCSCQK